MAKKTTITKNDTQTTLGTPTLTEAQPQQETHMSTITIENATDAEVKDIVNTVQHPPKKRGPKPGQKTMSTKDFYMLYKSNVDGVTTKEELAAKLGISESLMLQKRQGINKVAKKMGKSLLPLPKGSSEGRGRNKIDWNSLFDAPTTQPA